MAFKEYGNIWRITILHRLIDGISWKLCGLSCPSFNPLNQVQKLTNFKENNMHTLKTITLALLLVILSAAGLRAEEVSLEQLMQLNQEGTQARHIADYHTALEKYERGLNLSRQAENKQAISAFLGNIGIVHRNLGQYQKALSQYQQVLEVYRELKDKRNESAALTNIGVVYDDLGQYQKALSYYQQALEIRRKIGDRRGEGADLGNIGTVYGELDQYQKALSYFQQALEIDREIGYKRGEGTDLGNIGLVYDSLGKYQKALSYHQQALEIRRKIGDRRGEGIDLGNIGNVYQNLDQYQKALSYFQQALEIHREIGNKRGEGADLTNIGNVYQSLDGQYQKALSYYQQALEIHREIGNKRGIGNNLGNIGVVYNDLGQLQKALTYHQQALEIGREIGVKHGIGSNLTNIGLVYQNLSQYEKALSYFQQALEIRREFGDKRGIGNNLGNIGVAYSCLGQYQKALSYHQQALEIKREIGDKHGEGRDLNNIGMEYKNLGKYQQAKNAFQDSVTIFEQLGSKSPWIALRGLASSEAKFNQSKQAIQHYQQALDNIERLRASITAKQYKTSFMEDKLYVYDELIALLQSLHPNHPKKGYDRKAIEIFERKQGRIFLEEMGQSGARRFAGLDNDIMQAEQELTQKLQQLSDQPLSSPQRAALQQEQAALEQRLKTQYPKYYALKYPQPATLTALQKQVLQKGEMMLVYGIIEDDPSPVIDLENQTILWIIGQHQFQMLTIPLTETQLDQAINDKNYGLRQLIINQLPEFDAASHDLYNQLLPQAARKLLTAADTLYIIPTGPLYGLPFETLVTNNADTPQYLIQDYAIVYLSSASLLKTLRAEHPKPAPQPFLAFADPVYPPCKPSKAKTAGNKSITELRTQTYLKAMGGCFTPLPQTDDEVRQIAKLLQADPATALYLGARASRSNVFALNKQQRLDDYRYIMFSVHGVIPKPTNAIEQPALVLSNPTTDGYLTMADAFALQLNAKLVNLSACNTGRGENLRGEGIRGLTRAFMYAGTPATAVTLWSVDLFSAKDLSIGLFTNLQQGQKLANALRAIKLKMINGKASRANYRAPFHWAPFVVYGDGK